MRSNFAEFELRCVGTVDIVRDWILVYVALKAKSRCFLLHWGPFGPVRMRRRSFQLSNVFGVHFPNFRGVQPPTLKLFWGPLSNLSVTYKLAEWTSEEMESWKVAAEKLGSQKVDSGFQESWKVGQHVSSSV